MTRISLPTALIAALIVLPGCGREPQTPVASAVQPEPTAAPTPTPNVAEIPSGWITFRFVNASGMVHFALIDVLPEGVTAEGGMRDVAVYFQEAMDAMNAGDQKAVDAAFAKFPEWMGELGHDGGTGLVAPGRTGQTTVYLEPGSYMLECYVKSDGVFHTTPPAEGELGMVLPFTVTDAKVDVPEPEANLTLAIVNSGFEIVDGALRPGKNTIRVDFVEQQALPSFVGNDVHLMRADGPDSIAQADAWLDWRTKGGLEDPSPVTFLGGVNDMAAGSHGYFTADLVPGEYAFIAERPEPKAAGFVLPVKVEEGP